MERCPFCGKPCVRTAGKVSHLSAEWEDVCAHNREVEREARASQFEQLRAAALEIERLHIEDEIRLGDHE